jgi:hypothetical protein
MLCTQIVLSVKTRKQFMYTSGSPDVLSFQSSICINNLLSYCGLVDAKIRASDIDLPVLISKKQNYLEHDRNVIKLPIFTI